MMNFPLSTMNGIGTSVSRRAPGHSAARVRTGSTNNRGCPRMPDRSRTGGVPRPPAASNNEVGGDEFAPAPAGPDFNALRPAVSEHHPLDRRPGDEPRALFLSGVEERPAVPFHAVRAPQDAPAAVPAAGIVAQLGRDPGLEPHLPADVEKAPRRLSPAFPVGRGDRYLPADLLEFGVEVDPHRLEVGVEAEGVPGRECRRAAQAFAVNEDHVFGLGDPHGRKKPLDPADVKPEAELPSTCRGWRSSS